jgi:4-hydroxybenzoate polyprenyltransferase
LTFPQGIAMLRSVRSLLELIRFSHTLFALPFALTGAALAWYQHGFHWPQLVGILLCMVFARSAAMAFNRLVDREFDAANPRTAGRHLPASLLRPGTVWVFTALCAAGFVLSTLIFLLGFDNPWPLYLSGPVLGFVCAYSLTKRFTALSHFWLGASLFLAPVAAWIAIAGLPGPGEALVPLALGGAVLFWVAGFDILYACQDVDFDRKARLRSVPAALGVRASLRVALACHLVMLALLVALYLVATPLGLIYLMGVAGVAVLLGVEHSLVRPDDLSRVNQAFFQVNGVISVGLFVVVLVQLAVGA